MRRTKAAASSHAKRPEAARTLRWVALVLAAVSMMSPTLAQPTTNPQVYRLAPGDRISVIVFGQSELSGDMLIDVTGNVRLPFVGPIEVANLTLAECQKRIVERLADGFLNRPAVNVQISELRSIFILGDVRTAGAQPFKFGMNVKMAVAVAGGFGSSVTPVAGAAVADLLASEERVRQLSLQKAILTIRKARLEAQRDGAPDFPSVERLVGLGEGDLDDIVAVERETFASQMAIQHSQLDLLRAQKPRLDSEIEALNAQIATRKRMLELVKQQIESYSRLAKQGLGLASTEMQLRLTETTYESEIWNLTAQIARLKMDIGTLDIRIQEADATFKRQVVLDLREIGDRLKELGVTLPTARDIRDARLRQAGPTADTGAPRAITVTRMRDGQQSTVSADETTLLEPGDIIEIQLQLQRSPAVASTAALESPRGERTSLGRVRPLSTTRVP